MPLPPSGADIINQKRSTAIAAVDFGLRTNGPKANNIFKTKQVSAAKPKGFVIPSSPSGPTPPPPIVEVVYNFANCSATLSGDNIASAHIEWNPLQAAKSYKLFWRFGSNNGTTGVSTSSSTLPPSDLNLDKRSGSNNLFQGQSNAITGSSYDITSFNPPSGYGTKRITIYMYAYSDIGGTTRISNFPKTILQFVGSPGNIVNNKIFLARSTYFSLSLSQDFFVDDNSPLASNENKQTLQSKDIT